MCWKVRVRCSRIPYKASRPGRPSLKGSRTPRLQFLLTRYSSCTHARHRQTPQPAQAAFQMWRPPRVAWAAAAVQRSSPGRIPEICLAIDSWPADQSSAAWLLLCSNTTSSVGCYTRPPHCELSALLQLLVTCRRVMLQPVLYIAVLHGPKTRRSYRLLANVRIPVQGWRPCARLSVHAGDGLCPSGHPTHQSSLCPSRSCRGHDGQRC
jgi:hypothetical protein